MRKKHFFLSVLCTHLWIHPSISSFRGNLNCGIALLWPPLQGVPLRFLPIFPFHTGSSKCIDTVQAVCSWAPGTPRGGRRLGPQCGRRLHSLGPWRPEAWAPVAVVIVTAATRGPLGLTSIFQKGKHVCIKWDSWCQGVRVPYKCNSQYREEAMIWPSHPQVYDKMKHLIVEC